MASAKKKTNKAKSKRTIISLKDLRAKKNPKGGVEVSPDERGRRGRRGGG